MLVVEAGAAFFAAKAMKKNPSGGYAHTTNNRMEIMAAIAGLEELKEPCAVTLYTDSQYLRHAVEKMARGWRKSH